MKKWSAWVQFNGLLAPGHRQVFWGVWACQVTWRMLLLGPRSLDVWGFIQRAVVGVGGKALAAGPAGWPLWGEAGAALCRRQPVPAGSSRFQVVPAGSPTDPPQGTAEPLSQECGWRLWENVFSEGQNSQTGKGMRGKKWGTAAWIFPGHTIKNKLQSFTSRPLPKRHRFQRFSSYISVKLLPQSRNFS